MSGKFIVLEGGDGSGKSTLAAYLRKQFAGQELVITQALTGPLGAKVKPMLVSDDLLDASVESRFLLSLAMHTDDLAATIAPALRAGRSVISDRYDASNYAYQIYGERALHLVPTFWELRDRLFGKHLPDLYIFLDLPPEKGLARVKESGKAMDHFERLGNDYQERVLVGYKDFLKSVPHVVVDANRPLAEVEKDVLALVRKHI